MGKCEKRQKAQKKPSAPLQAPERLPFGLRRVPKKYFFRRLIPPENVFSEAFGFRRNSSGLYINIPEERKDSRDISSIFFFRRGLCPSLRKKKILGTKTERRIKL